MNSSIEINKYNHNILAAPSHGTPLKFKFLGADNDSITMDVKTVKFGAFGENSGIVKKLRSHETMDESAHSIEMLSVIPFGSEPKVARNINFAKNHAKVVTDIEIKSSLPVKKLYVDNFTLSGKITEIAVVDEQNFAENNINWQKIKDLNFTDNDGKKFNLYKSERPFLILLVKNSSGGIFEVGTGDDLWRWQSALNKDNLSSEFIISVDEKANVEVERLVLDLSANADSKLESRNWRFKWYFAWQDADFKVNKTVMLSKMLDDAKVLKINKKTSKIKDFTEENLIFKFTEESFDKAAYLVDSDVQLLNAPCFEAPSTIKALRKWLRSIIANVNSNVKTISLISQNNVLCFNATHLNRGMLEQLVHLDINAKMDFWIWANQQCLKRNLNFELLTLNGKGEIYDLPVLNDLAGGLN